MTASDLLDHLRAAGDSETPSVPDQAGLETLRDVLAGPEPAGALAEGIEATPALADGPLGLTIAGPAYQDNPIEYVNAGFEALTGYAAAEVSGRNPRLLQGPETESPPVADLAEAIDIWKPVRVELRNYRADGTPFRNRVGLVPVEDATGTVTNWLGIQQRVDVPE